MKRFIYWLRSLPQPPARYQKPPVVAINESVAHFCDGCRHFIAVSLSDDACPLCKSQDIKYAAAWMRTPVEQEERVMVRRRVHVTRQAAKMIAPARDADTRAAATAFTQGRRRVQMT